MPIAGKRQLNVNYNKRSAFVIIFERKLKADVFKFIIFSYQHVFYSRSSCASLIVKTHRQILARSSDSNSLSLKENSRFLLKQRTNEILN